MNPQLQSLGFCTALFVEDNPQFVDAAMALFEMVIGRIVVANDIEEARAQLAGQSVDLVITDIHLGRQSALPFIRELRERDSTMPVIVISGFKDDHILLEAMTLNLSGYLLKPIQMRELITALERAAERLNNEGKIRIPLKNGFSYDRNNRRLTHIDGTSFELNKREIRFFELLSDNLDCVLTRDMFAQSVWQSEDMTDSALNNFVLRLRKRFGRDFLVTVADVGYRLQP